MSKKRLFDSISDYFDTQKGAGRGPPDTQFNFSCPQCSHKLVAQKDALTCSKCPVKIPLTGHDLTPQGVFTIVKTLQAQHKQCGRAGQGRVKTVSLSGDDNIFLAWTCDGCGELEILL